MNDETPGGKKTSIFQTQTLIKQKINH